MALAGAGTRGGRPSSDVRTGRAAAGTGGRHPGCFRVRARALPRRDSGALTTNYRIDRGRRALIAVAVALGTSAAAAAEPEGLGRWVRPILSDRLRGELVDWFRPAGNGPGTGREGRERYAFVANQLRAGLEVTVPHLTLHLEAQDVRLANLPDDASLGPPAGNLGPGALYFAHTHGRDAETSQGETFLRQGFLTLADPPGLGGLALTGGRFEYSDGLETVPADAALAWLKRARIAERLVGPFNYTHVGRSFDGVKLVYDRAAFNLTGIAVRPTHGGFEVSAMRELGDVGLAGAAMTLAGLGRLLPDADVRVFWIGYEDDRFDDDREEATQPVKVDNRALAARRADRRPLRLHTTGAHALGVADAGPGRVDVLLWGVVQAGDWGTLDHRAWAYAVEAGYQVPAWPGAPWLRVGLDQSSGDDDPADSDHETFFQLLPTARIYAQLSPSNLMNSQDLFAQLILKPHSRVTVRTDVHHLRVSEPRDLWYAGGGATNDDVFGFAGIPADGRRGLAELVDVSVTVTIRPQLTAYAYYGHAFGQGVVRRTFAGAQADYGYVELTYRY